MSNQTPEDPPGAINLAERRARAQAGMPAPVIVAGPGERAQAEADAAAAELARELRALSPRNPQFRALEAGGWVGKPERVRSDGLPEGCPVWPLGRLEDRFYFLNAFGAVSALAENAGKGNIDALFSPYGLFPVWAWPRRDRKGQVNGNYEAEQARQALFAACSDAGAFDPMKKVRGRGAWICDATGALILHLGDQVLTPAGARTPGLISGFAYPRGAALPHPAPEGELSRLLEADERDLPGVEILQVLESWNWARGSVDARLMLGWLACAMVGGALRWRPYVYATGDAGAGKSTLVEYVQHVLGGPDAVLKPEDATEAGVAQTLNYDSIPVLLDENENEADDRRAEKMVHLARRSASGNQRLRGGADGKATMSVIRSCFMFASINMPTMGDQDMSRMAMLAMQPIPEARRRDRRKRPCLTRANALGRAVHRQVIGWFASEAGRPKFEILLDAMREALIDQGGHDERGADTFGFLLAGYWMATEMRQPEAGEIAELVSELHRDTLAELENFQPGWKKCLNYLLDAQPRALERQRLTSVRAILEDFRDGKDLAPDEQWDTKTPPDEHANKQLIKVGVRVVWAKGAARTWDQAQLFVPNTHPALHELFRPTKWASSDPASPGSWANALRGGADGSAMSPVRKGKGMGGRWGTQIRVADVIGAPGKASTEEE